MTALARFDLWCAVEDVTWAVEAEAHDEGWVVQLEEIDMEEL